MTEILNKKHYDLEERTFKFAQDVKKLVKTITKNLSNIEYIKQLTRSLGSIGANYIEANESLSKKDFTMRIKISRKESKESIFWLRLLDIDNNLLDQERIKLIDEASQLMKIFSAIMHKSV